MKKLISIVLGVVGIAASVCYANVVWYRGNTGGSWSGSGSNRVWVLGNDAAAAWVDAFSNNTILVMDYVNYGVSNYAVREDFRPPYYTNRAVDTSFMTSLVISDIWNGSILQYQMTPSNQMGGGFWSSGGTRNAGWTNHINTDIGTNDLFFTDWISPVSADSTLFIFIENDVIGHTIKGSGVADYMWVRDEGTTHFFRYHVPTDGNSLAHQWTEVGLRRYGVSNWIWYVDGRPYSSSNTGSGITFIETENGLFQSGYSGASEYRGLRGKHEFYVGIPQSEWTDEYVWERYRANFTNYGLSTFDYNNPTQWSNTLCVLDFNASSSYAPFQDSSLWRSNCSTPGAGGFLPTQQSSEDNKWLSFIVTDFITNAFPRIYDGPPIAWGCWLTTNDSVWHYYYDIQGTQYWDGVQQVMSNDWVDVGSDYYVLGRGTNSNGHTGRIDDFVMYGPNDTDFVTTFEARRTGTAWLHP